MNNQNYRLKELIKIHHDNAIELNAVNFYRTNNGKNKKWADRRLKELIDERRQIQAKIDELVSGNSKLPELRDDPVYDSQGNEMPVS
jgi:hypothetical protein